MTAIITNTAQLPDVAARRAAILQVRSGLAPSIASGNPFLRLLKDGTWVAGRNDDEIETGTRVVFRIDSLHHGWVCWKTRGENDRSAAELLGEDMVSWTERVSSLNELPHYEHGRWTRQIRVDVLFLEGSMEGRMASYKTNSRGGLNAIDTLLDAVASRVVDNPGSINPVARLGVGSYRHPSYGRVYVPDFGLVGWADDDGNVVAELDAAVAAPEEPAAPSHRRRR